MGLASKKKLAKTEFQKYIRMRDADSNGYVTCCTCGKKMKWNECDGGHFIPSTYLATCFNEENCHAQCCRCNNWLEGSREEYFVFMEKKYGRGTVDSLLQSKHDLVKLKEDNYDQLIKYFRSKQKEMMKEKCL